MKRTYTSAIPPGGMRRSLFVTAGPLFKKATNQTVEKLGSLIERLETGRRQIRPAKPGQEEL
jgi:hypothetical protein